MDLIKLWNAGFLREVGDLATQTSLAQLAPHRKDDGPSSNNTDQTPTRSPKTTVPMSSCPLVADLPQKPSSPQGPTPHHFSSLDLCDYFRVYREKFMLFFLYFPIF